jgi:hypothetical protein
MQEPAVGDPASLFDELAVHQGNLASRTAKAD